MKIRRRTGLSVLLQRGSTFGLTFGLVTSSTTEVSGVWARDLVHYRRFLAFGLVTSSTTEVSGVWARDLVHYGRFVIMRRDHLRRLSRENYLGDAIVHWLITVRDRKQGWLSGIFLYRFRELLTHTMFRYGLACPIFCLMPDHIHMIWMGLCRGSDQLNAMKHFRPRCENSLQRLGIELQDQAFDHVLSDEEEREFQNVCEYIARNPERAGLVKQDGFSSYKFGGCLIPGYPDLKPFESGYWSEFDRIISYLRKDGFMRVHPNS